MGFCWAVDCYFLLCRHVVERHKGSKLCLDSCKGTHCTLEGSILVTCESSRPSTSQCHPVGGQGCNT